MQKNISLSGKTWSFRGKRKENESLFQSLCRLRNYSDAFLDTANISDLTDSLKLPGMKEAGKRIVEAKKKSEKIVIFGDFDLDGASGSATLYFALKSIGVNARIKLPSRTDGYGLSEKAYDEAREKNETLLITVDCGSSNTQAITYGNSLGIETIITDHHTLPIKLPSAVAVVHPHRGKETDDTWDLTGAGVAFFLGKHLLEHFFSNIDISESLQQLAELAVLGTVADVGKLVGQNRILTNIGLAHMKSSKHPGLGALLKAAKIKPNSVTAESIAFFLAPRLNAAGRMAHPNIALRLLLGDAKAAQELEELNLQRKDVTADLCDIAEKEIQNSSADACFTIFHEDFFSGVAGLIAARISEKYARPAVVLSLSEDSKILTASCRGPEDFHFANALKKTSHLLEKHGGHACAAGFSMQKKNLKKFRNQFLEIVQTERGKTPPIADLIADCTAIGNDFFEKDFPEIFRAEPFGVGNPSAVFCLKNITFKKIRIVGTDGIHLSGEILSKSRILPFIAFRFAELLPEKNWEDTFDALVVGEIQIWNGKERRQVKIVDLRVAQK